MYSCEQLTFTLYIKKVLFEKRLRQKGVSYWLPPREDQCKQKLSSKLEERELTITSYIHIFVQVYPKNDSIQLLHS